MKFEAEDRRRFTGELSCSRKAMRVARALAGTALAAPSIVACDQSANGIDATPRPGIECSVQGMRERNRTGEVAMLPAIPDARQATRADVEQIIAMITDEAIPAKEREER